MTKTAEELNALKQEFESISRKLAELDPEELAEVTGGIPVPEPDTPGPTRRKTVPASLQDSPTEDSARNLFAPTERPDLKKILGRI